MPISVSITTPGESITSESLLVKHFQPSLEVLSELYISFSYTSSPSSIQVSSRTYHKAVQTYNSHCTLLIVSSWLPTIPNMFKVVPSFCPIIKDCVWDVLEDQVLKGLALLDLTL